jgi:tRNA (guanosine-2'-O-)-methyltransferase
MTWQEEKLLEHLSQFVSDHKKDFVHKVLEQRTRHITVVLENIYQSQNASAAVRTCECMGLQDMHIVENTVQYQLNVRVLKGANKWMDLNRYREKSINNTETCFRYLKKNNYKILTADPAPDGVCIEDVDVAQQKIAIVFGNELRGASTYAIENADQKIRIPMYGFTESLNISVSVAICLNTFMAKLRLSGAHLGLTQDEKQQIKLEWYRKIVKRSHILEKEFLRTIQ